MQEITIYLEENLIEFLDRQSNGDRSAYLANLLTHQQRWATQQAIIHALQDDINNPTYRTEIDMWDSVAGDGLDAEG
jgi:hypothetical protein